MKFDEDVALIAGPTASGKTGLAIRMAEQNNAVIINADSMQIYHDLRVITARPSPDEETKVPHHLFGNVDAAVAYSVTQWLNDVTESTASTIAPDQKLIFVGGTGLYFNALIEGLSPVPSIDGKVREKWRVAGQLISAPELHVELKRLDPAMADVLRDSDKQRVIRALEVIESTGRSLLEWQQEKGEPFFGTDVSIRKLLLMPDRSFLHGRINSRFDTMVSDGAVDEVKKLLLRDLDPTLPAMKAIGVPHLASFLKGNDTLDAAIEKAKAATRQYAKRQSTWFNNSFGDGWERVSSGH